MVLSRFCRKSCSTSKLKLVRPRDREASTQKLLEAGVEIFSRHGYDAATTRMVARRAGINESLIQRYFKSKAGLLLAIILSFIKNEDNERHQPHPAKKTVEEEIKSFLIFQLEQDLRKQAFMRVAISRSLVDAKLSSEISKTIGRGKAPHLLKRLEEFRNQGRIGRAVNLEAVCLSIASQGFAVNFMGCIVFGRTRKETLGAISQFAKIYARGLRP